MIIPNHKAQATLPRLLQSLEIAARGLDVERLVIDDDEGKGASWARNQGLNKATGDVIFFADADDTVEPNFFSHPLAALERTAADFCFFQYASAPLKGDYDLAGSAAIRAELLPRFIGYSFEDVRRWNQGGELFQNREPGSVCRVAFRRAFIEQHHIRFNEELRIYEDAAFLCECILCAGRVTAVRENLYNYIPGPTGTTRCVTNTRKNWDYKFAILRERERLEAKYQGVWSACEASAVFSLLEMIRMRRTAGISWGEFRRDMKRYKANARVEKALKEFPLSIHHPLTAAAVFALRHFL